MKSLLHFCRHWSRSRRSSRCWIVSSATPLPRPRCWPGCRTSSRSPSWASPSPPWGWPRSPAACAAGGRSSGPRDETPSAENPSWGAEPAAAQHCPYHTRPAWQRGEVSERGSEEPLLQWRVIIQYYYQTQEGGSNVQCSLVTGNTDLSALSPAQNETAPMGINVRLVKIWSFQRYLEISLHSSSNSEDIVYRISDIRLNCI